MMRRAILVCCVARALDQYTLGYHGLLPAARAHLRQRTSRSNMSSLEIALNALLFFGAFPALWLLAAYLDRVWPSTSEIDAKRRLEKPHEKLTVPEE
jgi:hypothetical protein